VPRRRGRTSLDQRAALPIADDNPDLEYLRLSRRDICRTEINAAVRLFLVDEDLISAHLLASAATEVMVALSDGRPGVGLNDVRALLRTAAVPSDLSEEVFQSLLHPYNFLKHGSSDFTIENDFSIEYIVMAIYSAVHSYGCCLAISRPAVFYGIVQSWLRREAADRKPIAPHWRVPRRGVQIWPRHASKSLGGNAVVTANACRFGIV
jgi:hypothetical protein